MGWPCYWLEPSGRVALGLRRYSHRGGSGSSVFDCGAGNHDAFAWRGATAPERRGTAAAAVDHADPAWPARCQRCPYAFIPGDQWQEWEEPILLGAGRAWIWHTGFGAPPGCAVAGPGAMRDGWWLPGNWKGPDGIGLIVRCPDPDSPDSPRAHDWIVDGPAASGGRWTRTGNPHDPPTLTVTPSIAAGDPARPGYYHGFLTAGQLTDHLGG
jgi:hypothetical protein